jgi:hypothetical protein
MDEGRSYLNYPFYDVGGEKYWREGFLKRMIENTFDFFKTLELFKLNSKKMRNIYNTKLIF